MTIKVNTGALTEYARENKHNLIIVNQQFANSILQVCKINKICSPINYMSNEREKLALLIATTFYNAFKLFASALEFI